MNNKRIEVFILLDIIKKTENSHDLYPKSFIIKLLGYFLYNENVYQIAIISIAKKIAYKINIISFVNRNKIFNFEFIIENLSVIILNNFIKKHIKP